MLSIQPVAPGDLDALIALSRQTFYETFFYLTKQEDFNRYIAVAYHPDKLLSELNNPDSEFYFLVSDGKPAAYLKINFNAEQTALQNTSGKPC